MSDKEDEIEWTMLEDGVEQEPEPDFPEAMDEGEPELFNKSYMDDGRDKKPPMILVGIIVLLILSVFWKKIAANYVQKNQVSVEKPVVKKE